MKSLLFHDLKFVKGKIGMQQQRILIRVYDFFSVVSYLLLLPQLIFYDDDKWTSKCTVAHEQTFYDIVSPFPYAHLACINYGLPLIRVSTTLTERRPPRSLVISKMTKILYEMTRNKSFWSPFFLSNYV